MNFMTDIEEKLSKLNADMKKMLLSSFDTDTRSKTITHFAIRNGPIEDIHADRKKNITDEDMMVLNKFVHNQLTYVFELIMQERGAEFGLWSRLRNFMGGSGIRVCLMMAVLKN